MWVLSLLTLVVSVVGSVLEIFVILYAYNTLRPRLEWLPVFDFWTMLLARIVIGMLAGNEYGISADVRAIKLRLKVSDDDDKISLLITSIARLIVLGIMALFIWFVSVVIY